MKAIAVAVMFVLIAFLAYVSASVEMGYIESGSNPCKYMRNYRSGEKDCLERASVSEWSLISESSPKCQKTQAGCELKTK